VRLLWTEGTILVLRLRHELTIVIVWPLSNLGIEFLIEHVSMVIELLRVLRLRVGPLSISFHEIGAPTLNVPFRQSVETRAIGDEVGSDEFIGLNLPS
jgi:hypothetical protein